MEVKLTEKLFYIAEGSIGQPMFKILEADQKLERLSKNI